MVDRRRARRPSLRPIVESILLTRFPRSRIPIDRAPKKGGEIEPFLSEISFRKEGPVNWRWAIRDFRIALLESRLFATAPGGPGPSRPSFPDTNCGDESLFLAPFPRTRWPDAGASKRGR